MSRGPKTELSEKHWKALSLLEEGRLSFSEIAKEMGWSYDYFYDLETGNTEKGGNTAELFRAESQKIEAKRNKEIKTITNANTLTAQKIISRVLDELTQKKKLDSGEKRLVSLYTNALSKCQPNVSIGSVAFSYVKGLTAEEMIHEFKRLKGIAESSFDRRRVLDASKGATGDLSEVNE